MLEIIYNDSYSQLTIVNNLNCECFNVIDDQFSTYETLEYGCFEPTKKDLISLFEKSLSTYFDLDNKERHIIAQSFRQNMFDRSMRTFLEWLNEHKELWGGEMKTINKSDMHCIGVYKGISQYELKSDRNALVCELSGSYYYSRVENENDYQKELIKRVCGCYSNGYDNTLLGEKVEVIE